MLPLDVVDASAVDAAADRVHRQLEVEHLAERGPSDRELLGFAMVCFALVAAFGGLVGIEVKATRRYDRHHLKGLRAVGELPDLRRRRLQTT